MSHSRRSVSASRQSSPTTSTSEDLYTEAYQHACRAVRFDRLGQFDQAQQAYGRVIETLKNLMQSAVKDFRAEPEQVLQKMNEYVHRCEQLARYSMVSHTAAAVHPDARMHRLYYSPKAPGETATRSSSDNEGTDDDDDESAEIRWYLSKAKFSMAQGELNYQKGHNEEALEYYLDSADWYKKAYEGLAFDRNRQTFARDMCFKAVDKAEELKAITNQQKLQLLTVKGERSYNRRTSSAERPIIGRLRASSTSSAHSTRSNLSVDYASSIVSNSTRSAYETSPDDELLTQRLSNAELEVLRFTSNVNNNIFLPWIDDTDLKEKFSYPTRFIDPDGTLRLSEKQMAKFGGWKRPADLMKNPQLIRLISSTSIVQDVVTDCSFVASLCVAAAYERKFKKQLITSCIYPQDINGEPLYNPNGKYVIKLYHNGIQRKVVVDDLLPVSRKGTLMCTFSTDKEELWASIIEKAYMKLMGGYDFPGSNSGIDLYSLTGWIPEHIFIHDKHFIADKVWNRIEEGSKYGDVLVTIATGEMSDNDADQLGLVPTHAYAVIEIKATNGKRFMQVKNPWSHKRWRGPYSHLDTVNWTDSLKKALNYDPFIAEQNDDGIFWIDFESVCAHFMSIHLNWNPEPFTHRWVIHSKWPGNIGPKKDVYNLGYNPQFSLEVNVPDNKPAAIWLLLSKHIMVTGENTDYITLHVYDNTGGRRIYYPGDPFKEGTYVNSPHILIRFNALPGKSHYTIVASQHEKEQSLYISLRAWSSAPFKLTEVPMKYSIEEKIIGQWTEQTAGGNASKITYLNNPQWKISIPPPSPANPKTSTGLIMMLEAPKSFAVHLMLVEGGKRVSSVSVRDVLAESGPYRHGFCYCEIPVIEPGNYTVVASTFEPDLLGQFILTLGSNREFHVEAIPSEGAVSNCQLI
ncbi:hypothetical protein BX666DRAFT_1965459, partial [Dichotomocladium elegans]